MNQKVTTFILDNPRYDQATFRGRLHHFIDIVDPRMVFVSQTRLDAAVNLLDQYKRNSLPSNVTDEDLWQAKKIKQAIIHPDTGEKLFLPFRMSGFVVFGSPVVVGLLLPNPTLKATVFWQWLNQSHNACVNYANRNATKVTPMSRFILGYVGAVTSAVGIAVGLSVMIRRANSLSPAMKLIIQKFVPFPAVAFASTCNVLLMRNNELHEGINIFDDTQAVVGTSKVAAKKALKETALTRIVLPAPIFIIPPTVMTFLERTKVLRSNPRWLLPINGIVTTLCFAVALPVSLALFPQVSSVRRYELEPGLQKNIQAELVFYNKGL